MNDLSTKASAEHDSSEVSQQALIQSLPQQVAEMVKNANAYHANIEAYQSGEE
jgi:hypothetical protein